MLSVFSIFKKPREKPEVPSYHQVSFTFALRKRKQEEEQFDKYHVVKEKIYEMQ